MALEEQRDEPGIDEGSWVYLSAGPTDDPTDRGLLEQVVEACANRGWRTVTHPPPERDGEGPDPGRFFASVSHAVEHADVVVAVLGAGNEMSDAELTLAYSHGRPVVGIRVREAPLDSQARMLLPEYERARMVVCDTPGECGISLQETLADPAFAETIRQAG